MVSGYEPLLDCSTRLNRHRVTKGRVELPRPKARRSERRVSAGSTTWSYRVARMGVEPILPA